MRHLLVTLFLFLSIEAFAASHVSFNPETNTSINEDSSIPLSDKKIPKYTIQITTTQSVEATKRNLQQLPRKYRKKTKLYKIGSYVTARYKATDSSKELKPFIKGIRKAGFEDALIVKTTKWHMEKNLIHSK